MTEVSLLALEPELEASESSALTSTSGLLCAFVEGRGTARSGLLPGLPAALVSLPIVAHA